MTEKLIVFHEEFFRDANVFIRNGRGVQRVVSLVPANVIATASDGTSVLSQRQGDSDWTNNLGFSFGVSYLFFR